MKTLPSNKILMPVNFGWVYRQHSKFSLSLLPSLFMCVILKKITSFVPRYSLHKCVSEKLYTFSEGNEHNKQACDILLLMK